jgi:hypothetical protein
MCERRDYLSKQWCQRVSSPIAHSLVTAYASIRIDRGRLVVDASLADVLVGYGSDFGAILIAVRLHSIAAT